MNTYRTSEVAEKIGIHPNTCLLYTSILLFSSGIQYSSGQPVRCQPCSVPGRGRRGCLLSQSQKRGVSNCPERPGFRQRGWNSSDSDWRLLSSSDKPLGAAESWPFGAVRNITVFSNGSVNTPRRPRPGTCLLYTSRCV